MVQTLKDNVFQGCSGELKVILSLKRRFYLLQK